MTLLRSLLQLVGVGLVVYGLWLAWPPLAFIVGGVALVGAATAGDLR